MNEQSAFSFTPPAPKSEETKAERRRNLVIEAGAGTGKTTAIVAEVLRLMLDREDLDPERIVLMTFTEKAAGEIADRIRGALEELANRLAEETPKESPDHGQPPADSQIGWPLDSAHPLVVVTDEESARRAVAHHLANIDRLRSQTIHSFCQALLRQFPI